MPNALVCIGSHFYPQGAHLIIVVAWISVIVQYTFIFIFCKTFEICFIRVYELDSMGNIITNVKICLRVSLKVLRTNECQHVNDNRMEVSSDKVRVQCCFYLASDLFLRTSDVLVLLLMFREHVTSSWYRSRPRDIEKNK